MGEAGGMVSQLTGTGGLEGGGDRADHHFPAFVSWGHLTGPQITEDHLGHTHKSLTVLPQSGAALQHSP